jgi:transcription elongation GreA/GreB family factor
LKRIRLLGPLLALALAGSGAMRLRGSPRLSRPSPIAAALLAAQVGDVVTVRTRRGDEEFEVMAVSFGARTS